MYNLPPYIYLTLYIYIYNTKGNFRPERVEAIAERFGLDAEQTLDNIIICRVYTHEEQMGMLVKYVISSIQYIQYHITIIIKILYYIAIYRYYDIILLITQNIYYILLLLLLDILKPIAALLSDAEQGPFRLIIVDSIIALFRVEFSGRGELSERQQLLGNKHRLCKLIIISYFNVIRQ